MSVAVSAAACPAVLVIVMPGSRRTRVLDIPDPGGGARVLDHAVERAVGQVDELAHANLP
jgi:hypothetical protein